MPGPHGGSLQVGGLCAYCDVPTQDACRLCGTPMCENHERDGMGICVGCAGGRVKE